jgi:hypothetical protein
MAKYRCKCPYRGIAIDWFSKQIEKIEEWEVYTGQCVLSSTLTRLDYSGMNSRCEKPLKVSYKTLHVVKKPLGLFF